MSEEQEYNFVSQAVALLPDPVPGSIVMVDENGHDIWVAPETQEFTATLGEGVVIKRWCTTCAEDHFREQQREGKEPSVQEMPGQRETLRAMGWSDEQIEYAKKKLTEQLGLPGE